MTARTRSRLAFTALVAGVGVLRLRELRRSARNERALRARGGVEHAAGQMPVMRALHGAWFASMLAEVWTCDRPASAARAGLGLAGLGAGVALRAASMRALGDRWTATVVTVPGEPRVRTGVFRWTRHPNYLGVAVEIAAVPLVHGAWATAGAFSVLNAAMLSARIRAEEAALVAADGPVSERPEAASRSLRPRGRTPRGSSDAPLPTPHPHLP